MSNRREYESALERAATILESIKISSNPRLAAELLAHPKAPTLARNSRRFAHYAVIRGVLNRVGELRHRAPARVLELCDLAEAVAANPYLRLPASILDDLRAEILAEKGNAHQVLGDYRRADSLLGEADGLSSLHGTTDPLIKANICSFSGVLLTKQGQFDRAIPLFERAIALHRSVGDEHRAGKELLSLGWCQQHAGRITEALPAIASALLSIDSSKEPHLPIVAAHSFAEGLAENGRPDLAYEVLVPLAPLLNLEPDEYLAFRVRWLQGRMLLDLGRYSEALRYFEPAAEYFAERGFSKPAALASLDAAVCRLQAGDDQGLEPVLDNLYLLLITEELETEAAALVVATAQSIVRGQVSATWLAQARGQLAAHLSG